MGEVDELKRAVIAEVDRRADRLWAAAESIGRDPEIGHQEHRAVATLAGLLAEGGIDAETSVCAVARRGPASAAVSASAPPIIRVRREITWGTSVLRL